MVRQLIGVKLSDNLVTSVSLRGLVTTVNAVGKKKLPLKTFTRQTLYKLADVLTSALLSSV